MKTKVRKGTFETNSSTQHTLCIVKQRDDKTFQESMFRDECFADRVTVPCFFGENSMQEFCEFSENLDGTNIGELSLSEKVTLLIASNFSSGVNNFLETLEVLQDVLSTHGIDLFIDWKAVSRISQGYYQYGIFEVLCRLAADEIEDFLFSDDCQYASWSDDCGEEPEEHAALLERIRELKRNDPDRLIVLHERC